MSLCTRCQKPIGATSADPLVATKKGSMHFECFREDAREDMRQAETRKEESRSRRREAGRRAWEKRACEVPSKPSPFVGAFEALMREQKEKFQ